MIGDVCDADVWTMNCRQHPLEVLYQRLRGVEGLLCLLTDPINEAVISTAGPELKVISNFAVGYDNIDISAATARKISCRQHPGRPDWNNCRLLLRTPARLALAG